MNVTNHLAQLYSVPNDIETTFFIIPFNRTSTPVIKL